MSDDSVELTGSRHQHGRLVHEQAAEARRASRQKIARVGLGAHECGSSKEGLTVSRVRGANPLEHRRPEHAVGKTRDGRLSVRRQPEQRFQGRSVVMTVEQTVHSPAERAHPHQRRVGARASVSHVERWQAGGHLDLVDHRPQLGGRPGPQIRRLGHQTMRFLLNGLRRERHREVRDVLGLNVLNDGAIRAAGDDWKSKSAAQEGIEIAGTNHVRIWDHS